MCETPLPSSHQAASWYITSPPPQPWGGSSCRDCSPHPIHPLTPFPVWPGLLGLHPKHFINSLGSQTFFAIQNINSCWVVSTKNCISQILSGDHMVCSCLVHVPIKLLWALVSGSSVRQWCQALSKVHALACHTCETECVDWWWQVIPESEAVDIRSFFKTMGTKAMTCSLQGKDRHRRSYFLMLLWLQRSHHGRQQLALSCMLAQSSLASWQVATVKLSGS